MNWLGSWSPSVSYVAGDAVAFSGSSYVASEANSDSEPPSASWTLLAAGAIGATGATGAAGPSGAAGPAGPIGPTGAPGLTWEGAYAASGAGAYAPGEVVFWEGASYVATSFAPAGTPSQGEGWSLLAAAGATGSQGPTGSPGLPGVAGATGANGESVTAHLLSPGDADCPAGGVAYTSASGINYVCNGAEGTPGATGSIGALGPTGAAGATGAAGTSVAAAVLAVGNANCPAGGVAYTSATGVNYVCNGALGPTGPIGATGAAGAIGSIGPTGPIGATGAAGSNGLIGPAGPIGATGAAGAIGAIGPTGAIGATGAAGAIGPTGPIGATGAAGAIGSVGPTGSAGAQGATGAQGPTGPQGTAGSPGPTGAQGSAGPTGATGATGAAGPTGTAGSAGATGATGATGAAATAGLGGSPATASTTCKALLAAGITANGVYWVQPSSSYPPMRVYCDMTDVGGGWTLVYAYTFTNYANFNAANNAIEPVPSWGPYGNYTVNTPFSLTAPLGEGDFNAMLFSRWTAFTATGEFLVKSTINNWIDCTPGTGSLVAFTSGSVNCSVVQVVTPTCQAVVPTSFQTNPGSSGPSLNGSSLYYYWDASTGGNWPTHDPCGTNVTNQLNGVVDPRGAIYVR